MGQITIKESGLAKVFTEWDRRYREDPEAFQNEVKRLLTKTPKDYGEACAPYFAKLAEELGVLVPA